MTHALLAFTTALLLAHTATAQEEYPPPSGKGRVVVVAAGASGGLSYREVARRIAALGYDAVLFETNGWAAVQDKGLRDAIATASAMPHALPGKVGLVGFSLGGDGFRPRPHADAFAKTEAALRKALDLGLSARNIIAGRGGADSGTNPLKPLCHRHRSCPRKSVHGVSFFRGTGTPSS